MMITIHGFPAKTKYQDVKILIKQECNINDFILDNLLNDSDGTKKVRIGLTDNSEGYRLMKCLDGYRMPGNFVLKAVPIGKAAASLPQQSGFDSQPNYQNQPRNDYSNAPRNDYMSQSTDYNNQGAHGPRPTHGQSGPHGHGGPNGSGGPHGPLDTMNRPSPWASGSNNSNQWNSNPPMAAQVPQNTFGFNSPQTNINPQFGQQHQQPQGHPRAGFNQGRGPMDQGYGYTPKSNVSEVPRQAGSRRALRSIETVDTSVTNPPVHDRYPASQPYQQDKPGPTQYNINNPGQAGSQSGPTGHQSQYPQATPSPWQLQAQPVKSQFSKASPTPYDKPYDDRKYVQSDRDPKAPAIRPEAQDRTYKDYEKRRGFSPRRSPHLRRGSPERGVSPSGRRISPTGRRISPSGRRISPSGRRISPSGRRISPSGRRISPSGRRISPTARRVSPHVRKFSPPGKRVSPDRRIPGHHPAAHHPGRRDSPHKRASPVRRLVSPPRRASPNRRPSPGRRESPQRMGRYSPERHHADKLDKYGQDKLKQVRPAYEPTAHASNQAMYSGGYRPDARENVPYPVQGMRQTEQRNSPWQRERDEAAAPMKKQDDDRRDMSRMQMGRDRIPDPVVEATRTATPQRKSRSPIRRERSPLRYKRHASPTRSSHSPRRSWALEKRRSPEIRDAPPPPSWPGQNVRDGDYPRTGRPNFPERDQSDVPKHVPVWERPFEKNEDPRARRPDNSERRPFVDDKIRPVKDLPIREPVPHPGHSERFVQREPKFAPREDYDGERRDNYRRRENSVERKPHPQREDYDPARRLRDEERTHPDEYNRRREPSPRHDIRKEEPNPNIDKDFEDIYKRALQFKKKAEELRRLGSKRRDDYLEDERTHHSDREREDSRPQRYEDRRFREEEIRARERDDRPRHDARPEDGQRRPDLRSREDYAKLSDDRPKRFTVSPSVRIKRDKAIEEICNKILDRHENYRQLKGEQRLRVLEELKLAIARIVFDMFGDNDVAFIEIIIKYQAKYNIKDEEKILQDVMSSLPSQFRTIKRQGPELSEVPAKTARRSPSPNLKPEKRPAPSPKKQRPLQTILRRKPVQVDQPGKAEPKVSSNDAKPAKGPTKTSVVPDSSAGPSRKPEVKKQEEDKKAAPLPAPVEPLQGGHYELNARMTKMVETELRDIMIKVWQELPDKPTDEAEALVVDKLRNKAGDDLRNVLGLNITKRLLNVHNPLYVKVQFSGKPEKVHLGEFLKKYNFNAFKRIEKTVNMFAAQVKTINDFDRICGAKDVRCGDIKVTVNPIYKFTKCPPNLITSFNDQDDDASDETAEIEKDDKAETKTDQTTSEKVVTKQTDNVLLKPKVEDLKNENVDKVVSKTVENKTTVSNDGAIKPKIENKTAIEKPVSKPSVENKAAVNKPTLGNKPAIENKTAVNKSAVNKPAVGNPVNKPAVQNKTSAVNKPAVGNNPAVNKLTVQNKTTDNKPAVVTKPAVVKPAVGNKTIIKPPAEIKEVKNQDNPKTSNDTAKKPAHSPVKAPIKTKIDDKIGPLTKDNTSKYESDYDELDDHDILALMSEGIVLDECSGSDDE